MLTTVHRICRAAALSGVMCTLTLSVLGQPNPAPAGATSEGTAPSATVPAGSPSATTSQPAVVASTPAAGAAAQDSAVSGQDPKSSPEVSAVDTKAALAKPADDVVTLLLSARCAVAICFNNGTQPNWLGIEPLVELPVGSSFSVTSSALSDYVNNHEIKVDLAAGARIWLFRDLISVALYLSKPLADGRIRLAGSPFVYPASSVRRPFPGIALGFLYDTLWLGFDRDELRNGDGEDSFALNPDFPPNAVISSSWTLTIAIQPVTAFRSAIGTAVQSQKKGDE